MVLTRWAGVGNGGGEGRRREWARVGDREGA